MRVNSRGDIGAGVRRTVPIPKPAPKPTQKASPKPTPKPKPAASSVSYGHRVTVEKEAQPRVTVKPAQTSKPAPVVSYGRRVKEERDPQPSVASKPSSSSQPVVTYGKRFAVDKSNGASIYESYKQPYAKPTGYSMDVKVDGVGKKPENRSILNTVDSGISKSNSSNKGTTVVTYSNNKGNSYLRDKREEMYGGMKGDIQKDVPSININNNSGYIAAKREQISAKMEEDKQSTYSKYDKYMKDNYINNKRAEMFAGMKPADVKISENTKKESGVLDYLKKSGKQILLGNYTKDVNLLGTIGQIGAGLLDIDLPGDIRDIVYDVTHLEFSWECAGRTALDIIGVLPVVGAIKYGDEVGTLVKTGVKNIDTVGDAAKETEIIGSVAKGLPKADEASKLVDITVKNADTVDDVVKEGDKVTKVATKGVADPNVIEVEISRSKYQESAMHIEDAIANGQPDVLTIDRAGAKANRKASLKGIDKVPGKDLDEYPPAMFKEGGKGASVRPINPSDNRGSGSSMGCKLRPYPNGTKIKYKITDD